MDAETTELLGALRETASLETVLHRMDRTDLPEGFVPQNARLLTWAADVITRLAASQPDSN